MGRKKTNPRGKMLRVRANELEIDYYERCAAHSGMSVSDLVRHLFTMYASDYNIPFRKDAPPAPTVEVIYKGLGIAVPGPVTYLPREKEDLAADLDPDRFDDRNTSTMEPLPVSESFDPCACR